MPTEPTVTIVLPVYNGEDFLEAAIDSTLSQTYGDFELLISDNSSTDSTIDICERYRARDSRVRLFRFEKNVGAARNFNHLVASARGKYFKWVAHDDVCAPEFLEACVGVLEADPDAVLCHSYSNTISETGEVTGRIPSYPEYEDPDPVARFRSLVMVPHSCVVVFGVFRTEILVKTPLIAPYVGSDRNLLAEIGLYGKIVSVPEYLFFNRRHVGNSITQFRDERARIAWFDPGLADDRTFPATRRVTEYLASIDRSPLPPETKRACREVVREWVLRGRYVKGRRSVRSILRREAKQGASAPRDLFDGAWPPPVGWRAVWPFPARFP